MTNQLGYDDDEFHRDDDDAEAKKMLSYFLEGRFDPDARSIVMFNVDLYVNELQLAWAMLSNCGSLERCTLVLKAAWALRNVCGTGFVRTPASDVSRGWNDQNIIGRLVQFFPAGRNGESFLGRTVSPAFDTAAGAFVMIDSHSEAVSLLNVQPSSVKSPECEVQI